MSYFFKFVKILMKLNKFWTITCKIFWLFCGTTISKTVNLKAIFLKTSNITSIPILVSEGYRTIPPTRSNLCTFTTYFRSSRDWHPFWKKTRSPVAGWVFSFSERSMVLNKLQICFESFSQPCKVFILHNACVFTYKL